MIEKVWIYILSKDLSIGERTQFIANCKTFTDSWTAHDQKLNASFELYKNRMLIMKVDESAYNASGCSIDKLQRFIQVQEKEFNLELLNRFLTALEVYSGLMIVHSFKIKELLEQHTINENTLVYDTAISSSEQLKDWKKPLKNTWLNKYLEGISH
ncbi:MAG TPA: hypothetical protein VN026_18215 [Bacteroidia bacterium]|jgi:hypothetical protein|nr:hypothetical protein [Bacteroidia bacterium]